MASDAPLVSVIVPCYNEQNTIRLLLDALYAQDYPRSEMEVIIADGLSTDHTRAQIAAFQAEHIDLRVRVVDNLNRTIPSGLNTAIRASNGQVIVRLDAHSMPRQDYVRRCVANLEQGLGENVGGVWEIQPGGEGWIARAIAAAAAHPLGVGDALYRTGAAARVVDTVPFGAFHRELIQKIGLFDETLLSNEDYEFNTRIRASGGIVWLDPAIRTVYFARASLSSLARQYSRYGYWKVQMLRRYPGSLRWRQALPPLFMLSLVGLALLGLLWPWAWWLLGLEGALYLAVLILSGVQIAVRQKDAALFLAAPPAIVVMHFAWGSAFLWGLFKPAKERLAVEVEEPA
jgi:cellulose synthase/poly-beta-1,6-N-acetylglucosamine synthase-like glycosyltransferase